MKINDVLIRPILTEKATNLAKNKVYTFEVNLDANKHQIKTVVEKLYAVKIGKIHIMIRKGKKRRVGKRMQTKKLIDKKLALIAVKEGKIDLFPQA